MLFFLRALRNPNSKENKREHEADAPDNNVGHCQEVILAAENVRCRHDKRLRAIERLNIVCIFDLQVVGPFFQSVLQVAVELAEVWQARSSHPHDKVL